MKIVVFDLDETLGYFTQFSIFWGILEKYLNNNNIILTQKEFNIIFNLYPEYLRPNIINILIFLKQQKKTKKCNKLMIYTNNNGSKSWIYNIINYYENKINYKLIDQIICAFKINGEQIEIGRTTYEKTHDDLIRCTKLPKNVEICFIDDNFYPEMLSENLFYINIKPYIYDLDFEEILSRFKSNKIYGKLINNDNEFSEYFNDYLEKFYYKVKKKDIKEYEIDKIIGKEILINLQHFFNYKENKNITKKRNKNYKSNKTIKKLCYREI